MWEEIVYQGVFHDQLDRKGAIEVFRRNTEEVRALGPDRALVWRPAEGWEPLCAFLGVPVPDEQFPRLNDLSSFQGVWREWPLHMSRQLRDAARSGLRRTATWRGRRHGNAAGGVRLPAVRRPETDELLATKQ
jgi:hypothetical protein